MVVLASFVGPGLDCTAGAVFAECARGVVRLNSVQTVVMFLLSSRFINPDGRPGTATSLLSMYIGTLGCRPPTF